MPEFTLNKTLQVLNTYNGRDKAVRTAYFALALYSTKVDPELGKLVNALVGQLSRSRLIFRQLNQPSLLKATYEYFKNIDKPAADPVDHSFGGIVTLAYTASCLCEFVAWLSDAKLLSFNAARWFKYCLCLWIVGLFATLLKSIRNLLNKPLKDTYQDQLNLIASGSDFVFAVNLLPFKFLWSGKLSKRTNSWFGMIASLVGLYRLF